MGAPGPRRPSTISIRSATGNAWCIKEISYGDASIALCADSMMALSAGDSGAACDSQDGCRRIDNADDCFALAEAASIGVEINTEMVLNDADRQGGCYLYKGNGGVEFNENTTESSAWGDSPDVVLRSSNHQSR